MTGDQHFTNVLNCGINVDLYHDRVHATAPNVSGQINEVGDGGGFGIRVYEDCGFELIHV